MTFASTPGTDGTPRDLLAAATPRPWVHRDGEITAVLADGSAYHDVAEYVGDQAGEKDAALIVAAVNEYEPLLDIAEYAGHRSNCGSYKSLSDHVYGKCDCGLDDALARLDAVRSGT